MLRIKMTVGKTSIAFALLGSVLLPRRKPPIFLL
jgi:hypothetical protein